MVAGSRSKLSRIKITTICFLFYFIAHVYLVTNIFLINKIVVIAPLLNILYLVFLNLMSKL